METHENAKCCYPQDKIYGLVGLADNSHGFVIDYQRSLFDVWKDTVLFLRPSDHSSVVTLASLCSRLLGGKVPVAKAEELAMSIATHKDVLSDDPEPQAPALFPLNLAVIGVIAFVGPSPEDVVKDLEVADLWTAAIWNNYEDRTNHRNHTQENDSLMKWLLGLRDKSVSCFVAPMPTPLGGPYQFQRLGDFNMAAFRQESGCTPPPIPSQVSKWEHRLFQLDTAKPKHWACDLGITIGCVQSGDVLCQILDTRTTLLLRQETSAEEIRIVGIVWIHKKLDGKRENQIPPPSIKSSQILQLLWSSRSGSATAHISGQATPIFSAHQAFFSIILSIAGSLDWLAKYLEAPVLQRLAERPDCQDPDNIPSPLDYATVLRLPCYTKVLQMVSGGKQRLARVRVAVTNLTGTNDKATISAHLFSAYISCSAEGNFDSLSVSLGSVRGRAHTPSGLKQCSSTLTHQLGQVLRCITLQVLGINIHLVCVQKLPHDFVMAKFSGPV